MADAAPGRRRISRPSTVRSWPFAASASRCREGSIVTILGANGAGKTTILKTVSGVMDPQKGTVTFDGREIQGQDPDRVARLGLSHVPEGREVFPFLTVRENLAMGAYTRCDADGVARDMEMVYEYFPVLESRAEQRAGSLSGGEQQMLAISRALMARPRHDAAGRAVARPVAPAGQGDLRHHRAHQPGARRDGAPGRAERPHGADHRASTAMSWRWAVS